MAKVPTKKPAKDSELSQLKQQLAELTDALQRERADATNVRRRAEAEKLAMGPYYKAMIISELLPFIDNFERAMAHHPVPDLDKLSGEGDVTSEWLKGINKIYLQLQQSLQLIGVEPIGKVGEPFDPKFHEAVQMTEGEGSHEVVSKVLQTGYRLGDEVIRHAMVEVSMR